MLLMYGCNIGMATLLLFEAPSVWQDASKTCVESAVLCDQAWRSGLTWSSSQWAIAGGARCEPASRLLNIFKQKYQLLDMVQH
jgi:hypothetical protein